jgi:protein involved in polysaccharide export with SLBB domain
MNFYLVFALVFSASIAAGCAVKQPISPAEIQDKTLDTQEVGQGSADNEAPGEYLLKQGDEIAIQVFDEPDLTLDTVVGASGSINYSYLGDIRVAGKSPVQLERHISALLKNGYLVNPSVNVRVLQYRAFYMNGEVRSPGSYPYEPGLTLDRAIALAGGLTERASTRKIFVSKEGAAPSDEMRVPLNFRVQPGDTITIKEGFF